MGLYEDRRIGDWIMVHGRIPNPEFNVIGRVVDINWRR